MSTAGRTEHTDMPIIDFAIDDESFAGYADWGAGERADRYAAEIVQPGADDITAYWPVAIVDRPTLAEIAARIVWPSIGIGDGRYRGCRGLSDDDLRCPRIRPYRAGNAFKAQCWVANVRHTNVGSQWRITL